MRRTTATSGYAQVFRINRPLSIKQEPQRETLVSLKSAAPKFSTYHGFIKEVSQLYIIVRFQVMLRT